MGHVESRNLTLSYYPSMANPDFTTPTGILAVYPSQLPSPTTLDPLSGGNANFVWRARLSAPLPNGAKTLVIKHAEPFLATNRDFSCDDARMQDEHYALTLFANGGPFDFSTPLLDRGWCTITVPTVYHYDAVSKILYLSDFGSRPTLKQILIDAAYKKQCCNDDRLRKLGLEFGTFLFTLHGKGSEHLKQLREGLSDTMSKQDLIKRAYYDQYRNVVATTLGINDMEETIEAVEAFSRSKTFNATDTFVMGDFWPGNILMDPETLRTACVIDWEMARFGVATLDVSQFCAELYMAYAFKGNLAAKEMLAGFVEGYGINDMDLRAFAVGFATHVTVVSVLYGWETDKEKLKEVARQVAVYVDRDPDYVRTLFR